MEQPFLKDGEEFPPRLGSFGAAAYYEPIFERLAAVKGLQAGEGYRRSRPGSESHGHEERRSAVDLKETMTRLEEMGTEQTRKIYRNHGAREPFFGVKVGDMKKLLRPLKKEQGVVAELYGTGNADAMYLAALAADAKAMNEENLDRWAEEAVWYMVGEYAVAGLAAEGPHGWTAGLRWIESAAPHVACVGWTTLSGWVALRPDEELDLVAIRGLLERVRSGLQEAPNRVRYTMNGFVIAVGCYVESLSSEARAIGESLGKVSVDMGGTACKVPLAPQMIDKVAEKGRLGVKRKAIRC